MPDRKATKEELAALKRAQVKLVRGALCPHGDEPELTLVVGCTGFSFGDLHKSWDQDFLECHIAQAILNAERAMCDEVANTPGEATKHTPTEFEAWYQECQLLPAHPDRPISRERLREMLRVAFFAGAAVRADLVACRKFVAELAKLKSPPDYIELDSIAEQARELLRRHVEDEDCGVPAP